MLEKAEFTKMKIKAEEKFRCHVENYLKEYVGKCYEVVETADQVFIGNDFPAELKGSEDTKRLCGANAKAKANATQKIPTLLKCATNKRWQENFKGKHKVDA